MDLKGILSISGYPGLYRLVSQSKNSIIVESLEDKKRMPAFATSKISSLEDIAIYTDEEDLHLKDVLKRLLIKEQGKESIDPKSSNDTLKKVFGELIPNYDKERVYVSDMKRLFVWYNLLIKHEIIKLEDATTPETETVEETTDVESK